MAIAKPNPGDGSVPNRPMNNAKARAIQFERRLREVATYEVAHGNRLPANEDDIFDQANVFRKMIECGLFASIDEIETTAFSKWGMDKPCNV
ncbi:MAG: hypothetical protein WCJ96_11425, partial [Verrucomicrobiota bacterium]